MLDYVLIAATGAHASRIAVLESGLGETFVTYCLAAVHCRNMTQHPCTRVLVIIVIAAHIV